MTNKNYLRGYQAEIYCRDAFRQAGCWAERSYASKGPYDVIAVNEWGEPVHLIQVKRCKKKEYISKAKREGRTELSVIPNSPIVRRELWIWLDNVGWIYQEVI